MMQCFLESPFVSARHHPQENNPMYPDASPVFAKFHGFPPIMVHAGSVEILRDDASRLGERAAEAGAPVSVEIYDGYARIQVVLDDRKRAYL